MLMKARYLLLGVIVILAFNLSSCKKEVRGCKSSDALNYNSEATEDDGSCQYMGQAIFWIPPTTCGQATIEIDGKVIGKIEQTYTSPPTCSAPGCVIFKAAPGTYNWRST